jgi:hypothetical protein
MSMNTGNASARVAEKPIPAGEGYCAKRQSWYRRKRAEQPDLRANPAFFRQAEPDDRPAVIAQCARPAIITQRDWYFRA